MKALRTCLASTLALLMINSAAGAWTLDRMGTGPEAQPGYFCRSPFDFEGMSWNKQYRFFTIDLKGQCGVIQDPSKYMPGWGGGGADFRNVEVAGIYHYENAAQNEQAGEAKETVRHEGKIILETSLHCDRNPWLYPFEVACTVAPAPAPVNNSGVAVSGPYPVSARYVETSAILAMRKWEADKDKPDPLADWDPMGTPPGYSALVIASPTSYQSIPAAAPGFSLALNGVPPGSPAKVLMNWQNIVQGPEWAGDIHLSEEARWDWWPFAGPPFAMTGAFPLTVAVTPGYFTGKPGLYRLQVKLESEPWWSPWRYFWIGPPQENIPHADSFISAAALRQKGALKKKFTALDNKSAERLLLPTRSAGSPLLKKGATKGAVVTPGGQPPAPLPLPTSQPPAAGKAVTAKSLSTAVLKAGVKLEFVAFKPSPQVTGKPVDVSLSFKNAGTAASDPGLKYAITCSVKSGGPNCPVANSTRLVSATGIEPGKTVAVTLAGASPAEAGSYELTITIGEAKGSTFPFSVGGTRIIPRKMLKTGPTPAR
ncbi:MAG: hypothetical protein ACYC9Y_12845 [Candidatus Methylomirabilia bacterium]